MKTVLLICIFICAVSYSEGGLHYGARESPLDYLSANFRNFNGNGDLEALASEPISAAEPGPPTRRRTRFPPSAYGTRRPEVFIRNQPKEDYQYSMSWPVAVTSAPSAQGPFPFHVDQAISGAHFVPTRVPAPQPQPRRKNKRPKSKRPRLESQRQEQGFKEPRQEQRFQEQRQGPRFQDQRQEQRFQDQRQRQRFQDQSQRPQPGFRYDIFNVHSPRFQPPNFLPDFNFQPPSHMNFMLFPPHGPNQQQQPSSFSNNNFQFSSGPRYNPQVRRPSKVKFENEPNLDDTTEDISEEVVTQKPKDTVEVDDPNDTVEVDIPSKEVSAEHDEQSREIFFQIPSKQVVTLKPVKEVDLQKPAKEVVLEEPSEDISRDVLPPVSHARRQPTFILIDPSFDRTPNRPVLTKEAIKVPHFVLQEDLEKDAPETYPDDLSAIPGKAGSDYPNMAAVPVGKFTCRDRHPGFYADPDSKCQVWHYCDVDGRMDSFLCPNGTLYNQEKFVCDWWYNVNCGESSDYYKMNIELYKVATTTTPAESQKQPKYRATSRPNVAQVVVSPQATEGVKFVTDQSEKPITSVSHQVVPATRPRKLKRRRRPVQKAQGMVITATYSGDDLTQTDSASHATRRYMLF